MSTKEVTVAETLEPLGAEVEDGIARALADDVGAASTPRRQAHDTLPSTPTRPRAEQLLDDVDFRALGAFVDERRQELADRGWDNLAHVEAFARALRFCLAGTPFHEPFVAPEPAPARASGSSPPTLSNEPVERASLPPAPAPLCARMQDDIERRLITERIFALLPASARARACAPLPSELAARADEGFALASGDLPRISPLLCAHLGDERALERVLRPGARVLAPRSVCPLAARGNAFLLVVDEVKDDVVRGRALLADGTLTDLRRGPDGAPLRTVDGKDQPITVPKDALLALLLGAGPDARGLDLRFSDDRCLLLAYAALLRQRDLWRSLERPDSLSLAERAVLVRSCLRAAFDAVALLSHDALACAIHLEKHEGDLDWPERAWQLLLATQGVRDAPLRTATATFARTAVWLDAVLPPGFGAGRLSEVAAGRAFARLVTSVLAPLGVLPCSGFKDGSGAVLLQTLSAVPEDDESPALASIELATFGATPRLEPLVDAWREGRGTLLPDARTQPQHDLAAMPSFLAFFLEAADPAAEPFLDAASGDLP